MAGKTQEKLRRSYEPADVDEWQKMNEDSRGLGGSERDGRDRVARPLPECRKWYFEDHAKVWASKTMSIEVDEFAKVISDGTNKRRCK